LKSLVYFKIETIPDDNLALYIPHGRPDIRRSFP
jgi:hypothetical protein